MAEYVNLTITSSLSSFGTERRFQRSITVLSLKGKLELITGVFSDSMQLEVFDSSGSSVCSLDDDTATLGSLPIADGMKLHVTDTSGTKKSEFEDVSQVQKYEMSRDSYEKKEDSVYAWKKRNKLGQFAEKDVEAEKAQQEEERRQKELAGGMKVGDRCEVRVKEGAETKRGTVMFVGEVEFKPGSWIGVKYDEPLGKNDGSVGGKRYFTCPPKYGGFVRPSCVTVGDFPEETFSDDEM